MLPVLLSAWFLAQFDFFVVNVAAPSIRHDLRTGPAALEMAVGGYAFAYAAGMITGGRLGDRFGYRRTFTGGVLAFTLASLLCGAATGPVTLTCARLLQGLAGAVMVPQVLALITAAYPPATRPRALGWYGAAGGLGSIAGQVLGGLLLQADVLGLGWRVIFLVNVPIGLLAAWLAVRALPPLGAGRPPGQDPLGALGLAATLALVLVPLTLGRGQGWPAWAWAGLLGSVPLAVLVGWWQRHLSARGGSPVLETALFRSRSYVAGIVAVTAFMAYFASFMFTLALLLQDGLGMGALRAGTVFAPMGVSFSATALLGPRLIARYGPRTTVFGGATTGLGLALLALCLHAAGPRTGPAWIVLALTLVGLGNGLVLPRLLGISLVDVRPDQAGIGGAVLTTAQQFAGAAGVAVLGTVFFALAGPSADLPGAMATTTLIDLLLITAVTLMLLPLTRPTRPRS
ncbi:MFS transporter [Streptomyces sp. NRRL F-4489]|nr:MFS transporter [Streptomyces sp. NRRL F-4489]